MENISEKEHIAKAKKEPRYFEALYNKHFSAIHRYVYRRVDTLEDSKEITSVVFTKALLNIAKYKDMGFPFSSWLYKIASNEVKLFYRRTKAQRVVKMNDQLLQSLATEAKDLSPDRIDLLKLALQSLNEDELSLIEHRFFESRPFSEIGEILEITENNAKVRTYRVLDKLKKQFEKFEKQ